MEVPSQHGPRQQRLAYRHVDIGGGLQCRKKVCQRCVAPGMLLKVRAHALTEGVGANDLVQVLQHGSALAVGDAIKVLEGSCKCKGGVQAEQSPCTPFPLLCGEQLVVVVVQCVTVRVWHLQLNGVSRGQLVGDVRPALHAAVKVGPGLVPKARRLGHSQRRHEGSKGFVQPQAIPVRHGTQIAMPHVCHFVQQRVRPTHA